MRWAQQLLGQTLRSDGRWQTSLWMDRRDRSLLARKRFRRAIRFRGLSKKNRSMFASPGRLYVYPIHAKYCMNVVTEAEGMGAAVLIRALEPCEGREEIALDRPDVVERDWMRGPSRSCMAMRIDRSHDGLNLITNSEVWIEEALPQGISFEMAHSSRIGISSAQQLPLRFFVRGNRYVSGLARDHGIPNRHSISESISPRTKRP
ncbi:MAG: DNA-3-methyladenine glycosylase [Pirellulales bacterium]